LIEKMSKHDIRDNR